jgi:hypothetical protein
MIRQSRLTHTAVFSLAVVLMQVRFDRKKTRLSVAHMRSCGQSRAVTGRGRSPGRAGPRKRATDPFGAAGLISPATPEISFCASQRAHGASANIEAQSTSSSIVLIPSNWGVEPAN